MNVRICGIGDEGAAGLGRQIALHRELGLDGLELRTVNGRGIHELSERQAAAAAAAVSAAGLTVPVVTTPLGGWAVDVTVPDASEQAVLRDAARNAVRFGCRQLRIMSYPNRGLSESGWRAEAIRRVRSLVDLASELGVTLLHENCHGWAGQGAEQTLELLSEVDGLGLLFDVGNGVAHGYDSLPFLRAVLPHVRHVHVKDGAVTGGRVVFGWPGTGHAQVRECLRALDDAGYAGWLSIEPHVALIPHAGVAGDPASLESSYTTYVRRLREEVTGTWTSRISSGCSA